MSLKLAVWRNYKVEQMEMMWVDQWGTSAVFRLKKEKNLQYSYLPSGNELQTEIVIVDG